MPVITRFAPSPTGLLHVGNIRTAIANWLFAKSYDGQFILRIDDTDRERSKPEYTEAIKRDLAWLGLAWDSIYFQSERLDKYQKAKQFLIDSGRLYPCYETPEEIELKRKLQLGRGQPPIYDRAALKLTSGEIKELEEQGRKPHWRFYVENKPILWQDGIRDTVKFLGSKISDPILIREDGTLTYTIASVVDDIDLKITDIIRGEDHITNTAIHIQLFEALGATPPQFSHLGLMKTREQGISKRSGGFDLESLRASEIEPMVINSLLALIGTSEPIEVIESLGALVNKFSIKKFSKSPVLYNPADLTRLNTKYLHSLRFDIIKDRLQASNIDITPEFWGIVKHNISKLSELNIWVKICQNSITPVIESKEVTEKAAELLPKHITDDPDKYWQEWMDSLREHTGKQGKALFMPIRKALTGMEHGPELKAVINLLGYDRAYNRLLGNVA